MTQIIPLEPVDDLDGPSGAVHRGVLDVSKAAVANDLGNEDYVLMPHDLINNIKPLPARMTATAAAVQDGQVVGYVDTWAPLLDNLNQCGMIITVHPAHRRQGIGTELFDYAQEWAASLRRTTYFSWMMAPCPAPGAPTVVAPTGDAYPADFPGWLFAARMGFTLEQVERGSVLRLPVANAKTLHDEALRHAGGYRVHVWHDGIPADSLDGFAALRSRTTIDAPSAGLEIEQEVWDADRVAQQWELSKSLGYHRLTLVAEHEASAELVAFTDMDWHPSNPKLVWQEFTFVRADHRGHRLGMLLKTAALDELAAVNPTADHIETGNAGENTYMLAINHQLGFKLSMLAAMLQKKLT